MLFEKKSREWAYEQRQIKDIQCDLINLLENLNENDKYNPEYIAESVYPLESKLKTKLTMEKFEINKDKLNFATLMDEKVYNIIGGVNRNFKKNELEIKEGNLLKDSALETKINQIKTKQDIMFDAIMDLKNFIKIGGGKKLILDVEEEKGKKENLMISKEKVLIEEKKNVFQYEKKYVNNAIKSNDKKEKEHEESQSYAFSGRSKDNFVLENISESISESKDTKQESLGSFISGKKKPNLKTQENYVHKKDPLRVSFEEKKSVDDDKDIEEEIDDYDNEEFESLTSPLKSSEVKERVNKEINETEESEDVEANLDENLKISWQDLNLKSNFATPQIVIKKDNSKKIKELEIDPMGRPSINRKEIEKEMQRNYDELSPTKLSKRKKKKEEISVSSLSMELKFENEKILSILGKILKKRKNKIKEMCKVIEEREEFKANKVYIQLFTNSEVDGFDSLIVKAFTEQIQSLIVKEKNDFIFNNTKEKDFSQFIMPRINRIIEGAKKIVLKRINNIISFQDYENVPINNESFDYVLRFCNINAQPNEVDDEEHYFEHEELLHWKESQKEIGEFILKKMVNEVVQEMNEIEYEE